MRRLAALVVFIFLLFGLALNISNNEVSYSETQENSESSSGYKIKIEKEKTFTEALLSDPVAYYTRSLYWATAILSFLTLVLACVAIKVWRDGAVSSRRIIDHFEAIASSLAASVEAATQSNNALISGQRANIGFSNAEVDASRLLAHRGKSAYAPIEVSFKIRNSGNVAATIESVNARFALSKQGPFTWFSTAERISILTATQQAIGLRLGCL